MNIMKINMLSLNEKMAKEKTANSAVSVPNMAATQSGMNALTFLGLKNLMEDPQLAQETGVMKDGAILINTARGEIFDPVAVADALKNGKLSYAALDVHAQEPIPEDYPLKDIDNVILTPHIAGVTADSFRAMMHDAFRNIECFDKGEMDAIAPYRYL